MISISETTRIKMGLVANNPNTDRRNENAAATPSVQPFAKVVARH